MFSALTIFNLSYLFGYSVYDESGALAWHFACVMLLATLFKIQFSYYLPVKLNKYEPRIMWGIGLSIYAFVQWDYSTKAFESGTKFVFKNQIFAANYISGYVPIFIGIFFIWAIVIQIRQILIYSKQDYKSGNKIANLFKRIFIPKNKDSKLVRSFLILSFSEIFVSIIVGLGFLTNWVSNIVMNTIMSTGLMLIYFAYTVVYANNSRKNITFMVKIVGITLVFVLVGSGFIGSRNLYRMENQFNENSISFLKGLDYQQGTVNEALKDSNLEYILLKTKSGGKYSEDYKVLESKNEIINRDSILKNEEIWKEKEKKQLIKKLKNQNRNFADAELEKLAESEITNFSYSLNQRYYREIDGKRYIYFITKELPFIESSTDDSYLEFGFPYESYRKFIHPIVLEESITTLVLLVIILILFPLFFRINLVLPLKRLLSGVTKINQGDLDVRIQVDVMDEIGYLTYSFNKLVNSIQIAKGQLEDYAKNLEVKVDERTRELKESFEKINQLKTKQDADYFLSSLLVKPLAKKGFDIPELSVDYRVKQKKEFDFKNRTHEIGGDYCNTVRLKLQNRPCTIVINADAMGKSLQGNGGILVLGSLFQSIITRTQNSKSMNDLGPVVWLLTVFQELQSVFVSFDGSMLISVFLGVYDEGSNLFYHFNSEHPEGILYRDKKASYLSEVKPEMKIGCEMDTPPVIRKTLLEKGDIIILGSDGREDLMVPSKDDPNIKEMNEHNDVILTLVENSQGDLDKLIEEIKSVGEITDDLSLLKLEIKK
ncbi:MAG: SpoIIE family protein phosphatase [Leptospiraceae bacterium]|nr:SpoIIE family protein phosphatase [Leptospiraceae bacterium]